MDLQQQAQIVAGIRDKMKENIGTKVYIKVNLGRSRINENDATIIEAHPSVFVAKLEYKRGRTSEQSFQYADILTGVVEVLLDEKPMFGPFDIQPDAPLVDTSNRPKVKRRLRPVKPFEQRIRLSSEQVAMLAERLKKEAEDKKTNTDRSSIISDLSRKYDIMKKAEKTKSTWDDACGDYDRDAAGAGVAGAVGAAAKSGARKLAGDMGSAADDVLKDMILTEEEKLVVKKGAAKGAKGVKGASANGAGKSAGAKASGKTSTGAKRGRKRGSKNKVTASKTTAKKSAAKASAKKTSAKASAKKAATKKSAGKKTVAKKAAPKKVASKKVTTKKAVAKKTAEKKAAPKKTAAKKPTAKKATVKKAVAKKASPKNTAKPAAKKSTVKSNSSSKKPAKKAKSTKKK